MSHREDEKRNAVKKSANPHSISAEAIHGSVRASHILYEKVPGTATERNNVMNSKVIEFPGVKEGEDISLRNAPFYESYLREVIDELVLDYARVIVNVFHDVAKGKAEADELHRILFRAQYACYLRGIYEERKGMGVIEAPGMPERPARIAPAQFRKDSR